MEIRFTPVPPPQAVRPISDARVTPRDPGSRDVAAELQTIRPDRGVPGRTAPVSPQRDVEDVLAAQPADLSRPRVQPDLPAPTRRVLELFVQNSFSENEDPAAQLNRIDVFV